MSFDISDIYKEGVPRKQPYRSTEHSLTSGETTPLTISPETSPAWMIQVESVRVTESSLSTSGTGTGMLEAEYPDYTGETSASFVISDPALRADKVDTVNSVTYYDIVFKPPIMIKNSFTINSMTIGLPNDVTLDSGSVSYSARGWTMKEEDYE